VSIRLAPGQAAEEIGSAAERLLQGAAPAGADVTIAWHLADPSLFEPDLPAVLLAARALERATGTPPALIRSGGSIPVVAEFAARGIPTIVSGFTLPDDAFHAPDESFLVANLALGERAGRELLIALAEL
jgi:acetylornithine deacetylase/succinyl-diaminopimelate desuccinylase-like protein